MEQTSLFLRCHDCGAVNRVPAARVQPGATSTPKCGRCHRELDRQARPAALNDAQARSLLRGAPVPVLLDFWAPWCAPCRRVAPMLEQLAARYAGRVIVGKINTDEHPQLASEIGVRSIPLLAIYRGGVLVARQAGAPPTVAALEQFLAPQLHS